MAWEIDYNKEVITGYDEENKPIVELLAKAYVRISNIKILCAIIENDGTDEKKDVSRIHLSYFKDNKKELAFEKKFFDTKDKLNFISRGYDFLKENIDEFKTAKGV
jgi:hypothetical protein